MEETNENLENIEENKPEETTPPPAEPVQEESPIRGDSTGPEEVKTEEDAKIEEPVIDAPVEVKAEEKAEEPAIPSEPAAAVVLGDKKWYVIQALTGQEDKSLRALQETIDDQNLKNRVFQILVPLEETVEIKGGKRIKRVRKMFPGYVFLEMILDEETWYLIRQTPGVARFIGTKVKPTPVSDKEMQRVLKQLGKEEKLEITFEKGECVRVISGPFRGYTGTVDEINAEKGKLKVLINIFGRDTLVEVNFEHSQKIV